MEYVIGILLIITFFGLAIYCFKGRSLMIGFLVMATLWTVLPTIGNLLVTNPEFIAANEGIKDVNVIEVLTNVFQKAPEGWGSILVNILWGAWFGRVLLETGVAATIIRKTVELGGDRPMITITLLNIVTAVIFTSMTGAGPVIAIGVIVLPIMMSLGVSKAISLFSFMGSVAAGIYLNPVNFAYYRAFFVAADEMPEFDLGWYTRNWGIFAVIIMVVVTTVATGVYLKMQKTSRAWAARTEPAAELKNAPAYALIAPLLPVAGAIFLNFPVILGFIISGFYALLVCGKLKGKFTDVCQLVNKLFFDGVMDNAPLIGFLLTLPMFNTAAGMCAPYFRVVAGPIFPRSALMLCIIFAVLAPLGLFRGPMTLVGCGAATLGVLKGLGFSVPFLYALFAIPTITMNIGACITQSWIAWGLSYAKVDGKDFLKLSIPSGWAISIILYIVTFIQFGGTAMIG